MGILMLTCILGYCTYLLWFVIHSDIPKDKLHLEHKVEGEVEVTPSLLCNSKFSRVMELVMPGISH